MQNDNYEYKIEDVNETILARLAVFQSNWKKPSENLEKSVI
jgi:hypothetical protein